MLLIISSSCGGLTVESVPPPPPAPLSVLGLFTPAEIGGINSISPLPPLPALAITTLLSSFSFMALRLLDDPLLAVTRGSGCIRLLSVVVGVLPTEPAFTILLSLTMVVISI